MARTVSVPAHPSNYRKGRIRNVRLGVVHGTVSPPGPPRARQTASYFAKPHGSPSSAHVTADGGGVLYRSVADTDTAYAAKNSNADGLHLELCMMPTRDRAAGAKFWASSHGRQTLRDGAEQMGRWAAKYHLPAVWLTPAQVRAGQRGLCDHATISKAYPSTGHWDVGAGFPVQLWLQLVVAAARAATTPKAAPVSRPAAPAGVRVPAFPGVLQVGSRGAGVKTLQARLAARGYRITVDGAYGPGTAAVVASFQRDKRLHVDGVVGPVTWRALWVLPVTR